VASAGPKEGHVLSETFLVHQDAEALARRIECEIENGKTLTQKNEAGIKTFRRLIDLHAADLKAVGKKSEGP
jgi:hypothetical protein